MAAYTELYIDQGTTFNNVIYLTNDITNDTVNLVSTSVTSQMRRSYYASAPSGNITCTITDAPNGEITMTMSASNTANLKTGKHLFDVNLVYASGEKTRILEGMIVVTPQVTR